MTDKDREALIGGAVQQHKALRQHLGCLSAQADRMKTAVSAGLEVISGEKPG